MINFVNKVFPFVLLPLLTRKFSLDEFGTYNLIKATIGILIPIVGFNVSEAIIRNYFNFEKELFKKFIASGLSIIIVLCLICVSVLFLIPENFLVDFFQLKTNYILLAILISFFTATNNIERGLLRCTNNNKLFAVLVLSQSVTYFIVCILLYFFDALTFVNVLLTDLISFAVFGILSLYMLKLKFNVKLQVDTKYVKEILLYSSPLVLNSLLAYLFALSDRFIISNNLGNSSVAIYSATFQVVSIIQILAVSFNAAWVPYVYKLLNSTSFVYKSYMNKRNMIMVVFIFFSIAYYFALKYFLLLILGDKYEGSEDLIGWMIFSNLLQAFYWIVAPVLQFYKRNWLLFYASLPAFILSIILNLSFLSEKGLVFAAQVNSISWLIIFSITLFNSNKLLKANVEQNIL